MDLRVALVPTDATKATRANGDVAVAPRKLIADTIVAEGGTVVAPADANAFVWLEVGNPSGLAAELDANDQVTWVQLPWAGVETFHGGTVFNRPITFTCAKGAYGEQVGEHALVLALSVLRHVTRQARHKGWHEVEPESLFAKRVTILGGGGIATTLIGLLQPFGCTIRVLRRKEVPVTGADETRTIEALHEVLPDTDVLVLALSLTPETEGIIGAEELELLPSSAIVVNVARGRHIDTDALVSALESGSIAGAGLDVTEPEPLPDGHPLWALDNVLVTSHCADSMDFVTDKLAERIGDNVARLVSGQPLLGVVDPAAGY